MHKGEAFLASVREVLGEQTDALIKNQRAEIKAWSERALTAERQVRDLSHHNEALKKENARLRSLSKGEHK